MRWRFGGALPTLQWGPSAEALGRFLCELEGGGEQPSCVPMSSGRIRQHLEHNQE